MDRVHLLVEGHVQGVGFRWFATREASARRLAGVARNRPDGTVEIEAEGEREALVAFVAAVRRGPPRADVRRVRETWSEGPPRHGGFAVGG